MLLGKAGSFVTGVAYIFAVKERRFCVKTRLLAKLLPQQENDIGEPLTITPFKEFVQNHGLELIPISLSS